MARRQPYRLDDDSQWWVYDGGSGRTFSRSVAADLRAFLEQRDTGADGGHFSPAPSNGSYAPSPVTMGDVVFYNWNPNGPDGTAFTHVSIVVGTGSDSGWTGTLVDEHTSNRARMIWNLIPCNSQWQTTSTDAVHLY